MFFDPSVMPLPEFVTLRRAVSVDNDAADMLMTFEAGEIFAEASSRGKYTGVMVLSKDKFAARLVEILHSRGVRAALITTYMDLKESLAKLSEASKRHT
mmetsp:Transcript_31350/g.67590  ORF Transcript_31350/g.67590 Transcript_31350/m.67590 type:complete len:99 (+) Transcript_31350:228-524(+)